MKVPTRDKLFEHDCQLKDMKLTGFTPSELHYQCQDCGGVLVLKYDPEEWGPVFKKKKSFKLSRELLKALAPQMELEEEDEAPAPAEAAPDRPRKFVWSPSDEDEEEDEEEPEEELRKPGT
ncbi:MAG TPA: hypothetical protein VNO81_01830 [Candidatus Nitrosotenuis sp.]|jgi:hypothetical protein|nr:hypothetical protein [Candidatus Nitrosotenuis sp.]